MINTAWGTDWGLRYELRLSYNLRKILVVSESIFELVHFLISENLLVFKDSTNSVILSSSSVVSTPVSIFPLAEYLCSSLSTLLKSGKCFMMSWIKTFRSKATTSFFKISSQSCRYFSAIFGFSFFGIKKSMTKRKKSYIPMVKNMDCKNIQSSGSPFLSLSYFIEILLPN